MIFFYDKITRWTLPFANNMLEEYRPIIQGYIGDELMMYYNHLYPDEQMQLIIRVVKEFKWFENDCNYYDFMFKSVKNDPKIIRTLKKEAISCCQQRLSKNNY